MFFLKQVYNISTLKSNYYKNKYGSSDE